MKKRKRRLKLKYRIYISYTERLIFFIILLLLSLTLGIYSFNKSLNHIDSKTVSYSEEGSVDYKVYLKPNDFYEEEYLNQNMIYVTNLIKSIEINYLYEFNISQQASITFAYEIVGKLTISDENEKNLFFEKEYVLNEVIADKIDDNK